LSLIVEIGEDFWGLWVRVIGNTNFVCLGFGWMKFVFEWWVMFGCDWVKKLCDLVKI